MGIRLPFRPAPVLPAAILSAAIVAAGCTSFGGRAEVLLDSDPPGADAYLIPVAEFQTEKRKALGDANAQSDEDFLDACDQTWLAKYRKGETPFEGYVPDWNYIYAVRRGESTVGCRSVSVRVREKNHFILRER
ncbi:MAG: hypothetical protein JXP34_00510 [Planctomycetes bacterium]|nr:hypothetical protein [Planctomycetota bacterium]